MKKFSAILVVMALSLAGAFAQTGDPLPNWSGGILVSGTTPQNGTSAVQTFTMTGFGAETLSLTFQGPTASVTFTGTEANSAISAAVKTALAALPTFDGTSQLTVATTGTTDRFVAVTFAGNLANLSVPLMTVTTSGTFVSSGTLTTPGVTADGRRSAKGTLLIDTAAGTLYQNSGTFPNPSWSKVSGQ